MKENYFAVIMAGGVGSRFWPVSTQENPKQFHDMLGNGKSLIRCTYDRLARLIPDENILIATNQSYKALVKDHLPNIKDEQIVLEPAMRNTAPCILYSALKIKSKNKNAVMVVAPSDHFIEDETEFLKNLEAAFDFCQKQDALMTLGIKPSDPNTGYGYIEYKKSTEPIKKVEAFKEKPNKDNAIKFIEQGNYLWNAGIFIWSVSAILKAFDDNLSEMKVLLEQGTHVYNTNDEAKFIDETYPQCENISIDYGVMEKADNVWVLPVDFGWNDLGTWGSLYQKLSKDNQANAIVNANALCIDASQNMIRTEPKKKVIIQGLSDVIVVETNDTILICPKDHDQAIKQISAQAKEKFKD